MPPKSKSKSTRSIKIKSPKAKAKSKSKTTKTKTKASKAKSKAKTKKVTDIPRVYLVKRITYTPSEKFEEDMGIFSSKEKAKRAAKFYESQISSKGPANEETEFNIYGAYLDQNDASWGQV